MSGNFANKLISDLPHVFVKPRILAKTLISDLPRLLVETGIYGQQINFRFVSSISQQTNSSVLVESEFLVNKLILDLSRVLAESGILVNKLISDLVRVLVESGIFFNKLFSDFS